MKTFYTRLLILIILASGLFFTDAALPQGPPFNPPPDYVEPPQNFPPESPPVEVDVSVMPNESLLPPPSSAKKDADDDSGDEKKSALPDDWKRLLATIAAVTGAAFILLFLMRKLRSDCPKAMPREVFEVLGKGTLGYHQQVYVFRCGNKLFLVAISSLGVERIGEITDPVEVEFLTRTCRGEIVTRSMFVQSEPAATAAPAAKKAEDGKTPTAFDEIYQQVVSRHKTGG